MSTTSFPPAVVASAHGTSSHSASSVNVGYQEAVFAFKQSLRGFLKMQKGTYSEDGVLMVVRGFIS